MKNIDYQNKLHQAEALYARGQVQEALEAFVQLNSLYPDTPEVLNNLGVVYYTLGQLEQAVDYLGQALNLDSTFQEAGYNLQEVQAAMAKGGIKGTANQKRTTDHRQTSPSGEEFSEKCSIPGDYLPIRTREGIIVCTPPTVECMTSFVLLEQEDWYEPEIEFVRSFVQPGMTVLDIGACFGVYALPMAKAVGPEGKAYAFEPNPEARKYLNKSREINSLNNLQLIPHGLSNVSSVSVSIEPAGTPELSTIHPDQSGNIELTTLDAWWQKADKPLLDFIKLDVNSQEAMVILGGLEALSKTSPVILFCIDQGDSLKREPIRNLQDLGFDIYRYLPGPKVIVPFDLDSAPDPFLLNLLALKPQKAIDLEKKGLLVSIPDSESAIVPDPQPDLWQEYLSGLPWTQVMQNTWQNHIHEPKHTAYLQALNFLCAAQLPQTPAEHKPVLYHEAQKILANIVTQDPSNGSAAFLLVRALFGLGLRIKAVQTLPNLQNHPDIYFSLPFLPPLEKLDQKPIFSNVQNWIMACCLESFITFRHFSSYFSEHQDLEVLKNLHRNPELSVECERKLALCSLMLGNNVNNLPSSRLLGDEHQNNVIWRIIKDQGFIKQQPDLYPENNLLVSSSYLHVEQLLEQGKLKKASRLAHILYQKCSKSAEANNLYGRFQILTGRKKTASHFFQKSVKTNPDINTAIATSLIDKGRLEEAGNIILQIASFRIGQKLIQSKQDPSRATK